MTQELRGIAAGDDGPGAGPTSDSRRRRLIIGVGLVLAAVLVVLVVSGSLDSVREEFREDVMRERIEGWGLFGPIGFVLVMWATQPFGVPGVVYMVPASLVWSAPVAIGLSWIGNMGASWLAFEATRRVGREWVDQRIPDRLRRFDDRLSAGGVLPIVLVRVVTGQIPAADWLLGVSSVKRRDFLLGTGLGILPAIVLIVVYGADLIEWLRERPLALLGLVVFAVGRRLPGWWQRRRHAAGG